MEPEIIRSPWANMWRTIETDASTGETTIKLHEDVTPLIRQNKIDLADNPKGIFHGDKDMRRVAHIPMTAILKIKEESGLDLLGMMGQDLDPQQWDFINKHYLNNSEWSALRTSEGRV